MKCVGIELVGHHLQANLVRLRDIVSIIFCIQEGWDLMLDKI